MIASRTMSFGSPGRYIQGPGEIRRLAQHTAKYGDKVFAVIDHSSITALTPQLTAQYEEHHAQFTSIPFEHEVTEERDRRHCQKSGGGWRSDDYGHWRR